MLQIILNFIDNLLRNDVTILAQAGLTVASIAIPALMNLTQSIVGANKEAKERKRMEKQRAAWNAENEAWYNSDYYGDFTQRLDVQNALKKMRDEMDRQTKLESSRQAVTGATDEVKLAGMDSRNKALSGVIGNIAASGEQYKEAAKNRYRNRKYNIDMLDYNTLIQNAQSGNNAFYNGLTGLGSIDWTSIFNSGGNTKTIKEPLKTTSV